jgi:hypothetical protein
VREEGRQFPDTADLLACVLSSNGKGVRDRRGKLAALIRDLELVGAIASKQSTIEEYMREHGWKEES